MRWLTFWAWTLLPTCAPLQEPAEAEGALEEMKAASVRPAETGNKVQDAFNEQLWSETWSAYGSYLPHLQGRARRLEPIPGETKLEKLGSAGLPAILKALSEPKLHIVVCARLLILAGRCGDKSALPAIERGLKADQPDLVRRAAARALGHLKPSEAAAVSIVPQVSARTALWICCMQGDGKAKANYFEAMERALRPHFYDDFPQGPQIERPTGEDGPAFRRERDDLLEELILLADVPDRRAVSLLVESLRHRDPDFPHLVNDLLKSRIPATVRPSEADSVELQCGSLHDGRKYRAWKSWLEKTGSRLKWSQNLRQWEVSGN